MKKKNCLGMRVRIPQDTTNTPLQKQRLRELCTPENRTTLLKALRLLSDIQQHKVQNLSLRHVDWMVTNYCKTTTDFQKLPPRWTGDTHLTRMHDIYLEWRRNFKRIVFDPFCRTGGIIFENIGDGINDVPTTVAQLNFFFFFVETGLQDYMKQNLDKIAQHQHKTLQQRSPTKKTTSKSTKKRHLLTHSQALTKTNFVLLSGCGLRLQM